MEAVAARPDALPPTTMVNSSSVRCTLSLSDMFCSFVWLSPTFRIFSTGSFILLRDQEKKQEHNELASTIR